jgi:3-methyladenine DNA glycosylase AlkD
MLNSIRKDLQKYKSKRKARLMQRFFKTGPGEYGQGDIFLGITVPVLRGLAGRYQELEFKQTRQLLKSPYHEERLLALLILILKYQKGGQAVKEKTYKTYLKNARYVNNWDLVDLSAKNIVGDFLMHRDRGRIFKLAASDLLWERRIAVVSTFYFIGKNDFKDSLKIARLLIVDKHDLIHKAVGWMLREVGKRDSLRAEKFLQKHCRRMPRTMLRYAIERLAPARRQAYLKAGRQE